MPNSKKNILSPRVLSALQSDSIIIFPTETLYGIGCSIWREDAVTRVFEIKGRAPNQPPPILFSDEKQLSVLVENVPWGASPLMKNFWPGSLTLILPAREEIPDALCGFDKTHNTRTIAIRQTAHPLAAALCLALASPIIATSANFSGAAGRAAQPQTLDDIPVAFQNLADVVMDGGAVGGAPSTIVDCLCKPPRILRAGAIAQVELQKISPVIQEL